MDKKQREEPKAALFDINGKAIKKDKTPKKRLIGRTSIAVTSETRQILIRLMNCLRVRYANDVAELRVIPLNTDDAITYVLIRYALKHPELADIVDMDSKMSKILAYSEGK